MIEKRLVRYKVLCDEYEEIARILFEIVETGEEIEGYYQIQEWVNNLYEENEQLKSDLDYFQRTYEIEERGLDVVAPMCTIGSPTPSRLELFKENEQLKSIKKFADRNGICIFNIDEAFSRCWQDNAKLIKENEQLKSTIKDVVELLSEEVDVFSDKATEHDINAYIELKELDNKDAFYMAITTKKVIQMLKEIKE